MTNQTTETLDALALLPLEDLEMLDCVHTAFLTLGQGPASLTLEEGEWWAWVYTETLQGDFLQERGTTPLAALQAVGDTLNRALAAKAKAALEWQEGLTQGAERDREGARLNLPGNAPRWPFV